MAGGFEQAGERPVAGSRPASVRRLGADQQQDLKAESIAAGDNDDASGNAEGASGDGLWGIRRRVTGVELRSTVHRPSAGGVSGDGVVGAGWRGCNSIGGGGRRRGGAGFRRRGRGERGRRERD